MQNTTLAPKPSKWHDSVPANQKTHKGAILPTDNKEYLMSEQDMLNKFLAENAKLEKDLANKKK